MSNPNIRHLGASLFDAFQQFKDRPGIDVDNRCYSWGETGKMSNSIANELEGREGTYVALLGYRSIEAYTGIFGIILSGRAYTPLNPRFPAERNRKMLTASGAKQMILTPECVDSFRSFASTVEPLEVICHGELSSFNNLPSEFPDFHFRFVDPNQNSFNLQLSDSNSDSDPEKPVYLLFTSGSTGAPKGVSVSEKNLTYYLNYTIDRYSVNEFDKISQMFDLTFDLSVHDIFTAALSGGCLCVVPERSLMGPSKYIQKKECTLWFSVPAVVMFMSKMRMLKPNSFPSLRYSLFCGEALPVKSAELWQEAAPNSVVENLYGPTEATIAFTNYRWDPETSPNQSVNGVVPIGTAFEGLETAILKSDGSFATVGEQGELLLSGLQVTNGYFRNRDLTEEKFKRFDGEKWWYCTGDLVEEDGDGCLYYLGRIDDQIQVRGHRVELQEIDQALREASGTQLAVSIPVKGESGNVESIAGYVQLNQADGLKKIIIDKCRNILAEYMVPSDLRFIDTFPLNSNGKIDRKELINRYHKNR